MEQTYLDILKEWEDRVADPAVYEHLDTLFPAFSFRRLQQGSAKDHWASRYKLDLTLPKYKNAEKTVVYRSDMRFREQGDWSGGIGVMDRIMQEQGFASVYEAYLFVSSALHLDMPKPDSREVAAAIGKSERRSALLDTLMDYFCWNLHNNRSAKAASVRQYLKKGRGFTDEQIERFSFGFVPDWSKVVRYITIDKNFRLEELDEVCGVRNSEGYTAVGKTHTLAIPYISGGKLKGFLFRRTDDAKDGPKYIANAALDRKSAFFNIAADREPKDLVVVEGEFDSIKASAEGIENAVAIGGSEISGERRKQIEDAFSRRVQKITLCLDLDSVKDDPAVPNMEARHEHLMKSIHTIKDVDFTFDEIYVALFKEPGDPDQFIRERGVLEFQKLLDGALPYWKYLSDYKEKAL